VQVSTELLTAASETTTVQRVSGTKPQRVRIVVRDFGSGMDAKTKKRLFEPFFTTKKRGTGLGMSVVRQIIELHGGTIDVQSKPDKGTTFTIEMPLHSTTE